MDLQPREGLAECHLANSFLQKKSKDVTWQWVEPVVAQHQAVVRFGEAANRSIPSPFEEEANAAQTGQAKAAKHAKTTVKPVSLA